MRHDVRVRWGSPNTREETYEFATRAEKEAFILGAKLGVKESNEQVEISFLDGEENDEEGHEQKENADTRLANIRDMLFLDETGSYDPDREQSPELWDDITNMVKAYFSM